MSMPMEPITSSSVAGEMLEEIRQCVEEESLSFIVGAGFSRNISEKFPLWNELLRPLAQELYPECRVEEKISEKTYLGIASEYVRRKGYHEAIDLHIEKIMPYLKRRDGGGYELMVNGKVVDSAPSTECHERLLALGARHIFTFNYDNTLDVLADVNASHQLLARQFCADDRVQNCRKLKEEYEREYARLKDALTFKEDSDSESSEAKSSAIDFSQINRIIKDLDLGLQPYCAGSSDMEKLYEQHVICIQKEIDSRKVAAHNARVQRAAQYHLITDACQISLTDGCRNIYKLHGSLRTSMDDSYEFDGDRHMQYVITQEDYDTYPEKHEAFVNLMRISLLKGNFCLIGFSGDDPNFLGWINWGKDILDGSASRRVPVPRTIYYVNAELDRLEPSKEQLLKNHYIKVLNLRECFPAAETRQEQVLMFLTYLGRDKEKYAAYDGSWRKLDVDGGKSDGISGAAMYIEDVYELSEYNRIPDQFGMAHYRRTNVLSRIKSILKSEDDLLLRSKLIYSAIKGELMPVHAVLNSGQYLQLSKTGKDLDKRYQQLHIRNQVLEGLLVDDRSSDWATYETALSLLFNLRFDEAGRVLDDWTPQEGVDRMRRFMLQSVYEKGPDADSITSLISPDNFSCLQDYKYALDLLPQIRGMFMKNKKGGMSVYADLQQQIDLMSRQHPHLVRFHEQIEDLVDQANKSKPKPFGNTKKTFTFGSYDAALVNSTKVLQILLELGIPTETRNTVLIDKEKWLNVCERLFECYPKPCLYLSLLYGNDKDLVRRIAQHYIYSSKLRDALPGLLTRMLEALSEESCPSDVREAIYIAAPVFMRAVQPDLWLASFDKFYDSLELQKFGDERGGNELHSFVVAGVELADDAEFKHKVLLQTLQLGDNIRETHNSIIIAASKELEVNASEREALLHLLACASKPVHLYVLMNMSRWVGRDDVTAKLKALDDDLYADCTLLEAASQYAEDDVSFQSRLKTIILRSPLLWQTGIDEDCAKVSYCGYTLDICDIQQYIRFDDEEIRSIYGRLTKAFGRIDILTRKWNERSLWGFLNDWSYILVEMQDFLRNNRRVLKGEDGYSSISRSVTRLLNQGRGGGSISSLLLEDGKTAKAISWMVHDVYNRGARHLQYEYVLLANKLLSRQSACLNSCFRHFGWSLVNYENDFDRELLKPLLKGLFDLYESYFRGADEWRWDVENAEKNVVERELVKMYEVYKSWGGYNRFWDGYAPRYYGK